MSNGAHPQATILMATDVPFWRGRTGAQQRMLSLVQHLDSQSFRVVTFFLGQAEPGDRQCWQRLKLELREFDRQRPPDGWLERVPWYCEAIWRQLLRRSSDPPATAARTRAAARELRVADYRWPRAIEQFAHLFDELQPAAVLCQYLTTAYLLDGLDSEARSRTRCLLDTHDVLHERKRQFAAEGHRHWLQVGPEEEIAVWNRFDALLAIQPREAQAMLRATRGPQVLLVPHGVELPPTAKRLGLSASRVEADKLHSAGDFVLGYLGSDNSSNLEAVKSFLCDAWPELLKHERPRLRLLVGGSVCNSLLPIREAGVRSSASIPSRCFERVELAGDVERLDDFYGQIDLALNPVGFGTGLKIKNVEALSFGVPLVSTRQGVEGLPGEVIQWCLIADSVAEIPGLLRPWLTQPERLAAMGRQAQEAAKSAFSPQQAYAELLQYLVGPA